MLFFVLWIIGLTTRGLCHSSNIRITRLLSTFMVNKNSTVDMQSGWNFLHSFTFASSSKYKEGKSRVMADSQNWRILLLSTRWMMLNMLMIHIFGRLWNCKAFHKSIFWDQDTKFLSHYWRRYGTWLLLSYGLLFHVMHKPMANSKFVEGIGW